MKVALNGGHTCQVKHPSTHAHKFPRFDREYRHTEVKKKFHWAVSLISESVNAAFLVQKNLWSFKTCIGTIISRVNSAKRVKVAYLWRNFTALKRVVRVTYGTPGRNSTPQPVGRTFLVPDYLSASRKMENNNRRRVFAERLKLVSF